LFGGYKNRDQIELRVDLGDLQKEKEQLTNFLKSHLQVSITPHENKLRLKSEKLSAQELRRVVTKFVYHRNFNTTHYVSIKGKTVKINRFKSTAKKTEKHKRSAPHQTEIQSWGL
jgi:hypothetical protein